MAVCCQNLPLGALSSRSVPSVLVGMLFKKFGLFFEHAEIQENVIRELCAITESAFQKAFQQWKKCWEWCYRQ
jgi:ABC-type polar amino acid transport system ATPase subunit